MAVTRLALTWIGWPNVKNLRRPACKFDLNQSERKSSQVNASARKSWPNGVASRPRFSTCGYLRLRLSRALSSGQTDRKVVASGRKLNLRRDLHWVAKRTRKFPLKYTWVAKKNHFKADISCISLTNHRLMDVAQLALTWVGWPNGEKLAFTCVQIWPRPKWAQVIASQRKCTQALAKRVASRPKFSTCVYLRLRLAKAL